MISLLLEMLLADRVPLLALSAGLLLVHELALHAGLAGYLLSDGARRSLLDQNKEGLLILPGYVAFHLLFQRCMRRVHLARAERESAGLRTRLAQHFGRMALLSALVAICGNYLSYPISRRCLSVAFLATILALMLALLALEFALERLMQLVLGDRLDLSAVHSPFLRNYGQHGLKLFLLANVLTGAVNLSMDTMHTGRTTAMGVLTGYLALATAGSALLGRVPM